MERLIYEAAKRKYKCGKDAEGRHRNPKNIKNMFIKKEEVL